ncbi:MAG: hypothetical protein GY859_14700 [Desulfobacterales bacterium]|nr:hypothetical protein [Desulfobacterales bacterium]
MKNAVSMNVTMEHTAQVGASFGVSRRKFWRKSAQVLAQVGASLAQVGASFGASLRKFGASRRKSAQVWRKFGVSFGVRIDPSAAGRNEIRIVGRECHAEHDKILFSPQPPSPPSARQELRRIKMEHVYIIGEE